MPSGDVTDALVAELAVRLEDEAENAFSEETKIKMLDKAQLELCNFLHDGYLTEFEVMETVAGATTSVAFSSLNSGNGVLHGAEGILKVRIAPGGGDTVIAIQIDLREIKKTTNIYQAYNNARPMYYIFAGTIYLLLTTQSANDVDVFFLKKPATLSTTVDPILNTSLHHLMLDLAEAKCWGMNNQFDRKNAVMEHALAQIETLNARYKEVLGIGTKSKGVK
jgi:hypothetical protein